MGILGIDNAYPITDLSQAKAEGYSFDMRYGPPSIYEMSQAECENIRGQDFGVGHVFEVGGDRALHGAEQGDADGRTHDAWATACGAPSWVRLVYVAEDMDMTVEQIRGPVTAYARAFDAACTRPTMPYGSYDTIEILCGEMGVAPFGWQTAGWSGYGQGSGGSFHCSDGSNRRLSKYTAMFQDVGYVLNNQADRNVVLAGFGVDWAWGGPYVGPQEPPKEDDMINWRPTICKNRAPDVWWRLVPDGTGFRRQLLPGKRDDANRLWGQGYLQDPNPIEYDDTGTEDWFMAFPETYTPINEATLEDIVKRAVHDAMDGVTVNSSLTDADVERIAKRAYQLHGQQLVSGSPG